MSSTTMSLRQLPMRISRPLGHQCLRSFSTTTSRPQAQNSSAKGLVDEIGTSIADFSQDRILRAAKKAKSGSAFSAAEQRAQQARDDYGKQMMYRKWESGDIYAPHDLSGAEQAKWKRAKARPQGDAVDMLGINPLLEYKNYTIMSEFMTEVGRIKPGKLSGLRPVNQRKMAKAIRRAVGLGLMPSVYRHPLTLKAHKMNRFS